MLSAILRKGCTGSKLVLHTNVRKRLSPLQLFSTLPKSTSDILFILKSLDKSLRNPGTANADSVISDFEDLHKFGTVIPLTYCIDAARMLSYRHDALRMELLIHICRKNMEVVQDPLLIYSKHGPLNHLITSSITGLFRQGDMDEASLLWMRMSRNGYETTSSDMGFILDQLVGGRHCNPSLELIDFLHSSVRAHSWHQSPIFYSRLLKLYRQHILTVCNSNKSLKMAIDRVEILWREAQDVLTCPTLRDESLINTNNPGTLLYDGVTSSSNVLNTELHSARLSCYVAAMRTSQQIIVDSSFEAPKLASPSAIEKTIVEESPIVDMAITTTSVASMSPPLRNQWYVPNTTAAEMLSISTRLALSALKDLVNPSSVAQQQHLQKKQQLLSPNQILFELSNEVKSILANKSLTKFDDNHNDDSTIIVTTNTNDLTSPMHGTENNLRKSISIMLLTLAEQGQTAEALLLLKEYLQQQSVAGYPNSINNNSSRLHHYQHKLESADYFENIIQKQKAKNADMQAMRSTVLDALSKRWAFGQQQQQEQRQSSISNTFSDVDYRKTSYRNSKTEATDSSSGSNENTVSNNIHRGTLEEKNKSQQLVQQQLLWQEELICSLLSRCNLVAPIEHSRIAAALDEAVSAAAVASNTETATGSSRSSSISSTTSALFKQISSSFISIDKVQSINKSASTSSAAEGTRGRRLDFEVYKGLSSIFAELFEIVKTYNMKPGAAFYAAYIDALTFNLQYAARLSVSENQPQQHPQSIHWASAFEAAQLMLDPLVEKISKSPQVQQSLVKLLCAGSLYPDPDPDAVYRAIKLVQQLRSSPHSSSAVTPAILCELLNAATMCLDDVKLGQLLSQLEGLFDSVTKSVLDYGNSAYDYNYVDDGSGAGSSSRSSSKGEAPTAASIEEVRKVLKAQIYAHCRLREGVHALRMLKKLRSISYSRGIKHYKEQHQQTDLMIYRWILTAIYQMQPRSESEWMIAKDPEGTAEYLYREMLRDGHNIDSDMFVRLLQLFTKAALIGKYQGSYKPVLSSMQNFIDNCSRKGGLHGMQKEIQMDERAIRELVKAFMVTEQEQKALSVIAKAESKYGVKITSATVYDPIIFYFSGLHGLIDTAEEILADMLNRNIPLNEYIVVPFALGYMRHGDLKDALDCIQDMYNQHKVRPTVTLWMLLLDASLSRKDVDEARRVVDVIRQMYTEQERRLLIGPVVQLNEVQAAKMYKKVGKHLGYDGNSNLKSKNHAVQKISENEVSNSSSGSADNNIYVDPALQAALLRDEQEQLVLNAALELEVGGDMQQKEEEIIIEDTDPKGSNMEAELYRRLYAAASYWHPSSEEDRDDDDDDYGNQGIRITKAPPSEYLPPRGYLLKMVTPLGQQQRGVLSDSMLDERFQYYKLSLYNQKISSVGKNY